MAIAKLKEKYRIPGIIEFSIGAGKLPVIIVSNEFATAIISIYGGQVLSYQPKGQKDLLWLSEKSFYEEGKAIRGGIPICFPWFGPHPTDALLPQHGFARLSIWEVGETSVLENGASKIKLQLHQTPATIAFWPFDFSATLMITVGVKLEVALTVINTGDKTFTYSDALHSYLNVSDVNTISIDGLRLSDYYEAFSKERKQQEEPLLVIAKPENRRYVHHTADCVVYDKGYSRKLRISKTGSKVTVVWNPGAEETKKMKDMSEDGYKTFICVEAANSYDDSITLDPNQQFTISTTIGS